MQSFTAWASQTVRPDLRREFLASLSSSSPRPLEDPLAEAWRVFLSRWRWELFATLTFAVDVGEETAEAAWSIWLDWLERHVQAPLDWIRADEFTKARRLHFHALLGGSWSRFVRRLSAMDAWMDIRDLKGGPLAGWARVEVPRSENAVRAYCSKYVVKGGQILLSPALGALERQAPFESFRVAAQSRPSARAKTSSRPRVRRGAVPRAGRPLARASDAPTPERWPDGGAGRGGSEGGAVA